MDGPLSIYPYTSFFTSIGRFHSLSLFLYLFLALSIPSSIYLFFVPFGYRTCFLFLSMTAPFLSVSLSLHMYFLPVLHHHLSFYLSFSQSLSPPLHVYYCLSLILLLWESNPGTTDAMQHVLTTTPTHPYLISIPNTISCDL